MWACIQPFICVKILSSIHPATTLIVFFCYVCFVLVFVHWSQFSLRKGKHLLLNFSFHILVYDICPHFVVGTFVVWQNVSTYVMWSGYTNGNINAYVLFYFWKIVYHTTLLGHVGYMDRLVGFFVFNFAPSMTSVNFFWTFAENVVETGETDTCEYR